MSFLEGFFDAKTPLIVHPELDYRKIILIVLENI